MTATGTPRLGLGSLGYFARRDLRDHGGRSDHVGGALLTSGTTGHLRFQAIFASAYVLELERGHFRLSVLEGRKRTIPARGTGAILVLVFYPLAVAAIEAIADMHASTVHRSGVENVKLAHETHHRPRWIFDWPWRMRTRSHLEFGGKLDVAISSRAAQSLS
jgi:hypothetical protein